MAKQSKGNCIFCGREMTKTGLIKHLSACSQRQEMIGKAKGQSEKSETLYHLQVQDAWKRDYWLHLEMKGSATLNNLDTYLRAIWLECCGHMSQFSFGGWSGRELPKSAKVDQIFQLELEVTHIYDFGTSSETLVKAVEKREGKALSKHPIYLMARNNMPPMECMECGEPATWFCMECIFEDEETGALCERHMENHPHDQYGEPLPMVNSPRMGMCGYIGPADPPY